METLSLALFCFGGMLFFLFLRPRTGWAAGGDYFRDKEMTMIVATHPGGSYDEYGQLLAGALERQLQARVRVRYVAGAGMINGANAIFAAAPDGLTVGTFNMGLIVAQLRGQEQIKFDLNKFTWLCNCAAMPRMLAVRTALPYAQIEELERPAKTLRFPTSGLGSSAHNDVLMIKAVLGLNIEPDGRYGGTATNTAIAGGAVDGRVGFTSSLLPFIQKGELRPLLLIADKRDPAYPEIPTLTEIAPQDKQPLVRLMVALAEISWPFAAPPGIPESIRKPLRQAFAEAFADRETQDRARRAKLPLHYYGPAEVEKMVADALRQPPEVISFIRLSGDTILVFH